MKRGLVVAAAFLCVLALGSASGNASPQAAQFKVAGKAWPGHVITYFNGVPEQSKAVAAAAAIWNASGANVRFRPAPRASAEVVIYAIPRNYPAIAGGEATIGYTPKTSTILEPFPRLKLDKQGRPIGIIGLPKEYHGGVMWLRHLKDRVTGNRDPYYYTAIAAHEFGHILGLGHETGACALMNPQLLQMSKCGRVEFWQHYCGVLAPDDIKGAVRLYGGRATKPTLGVCDLTPAPAPPTGFKVAIQDYSSSLILTWSLAQPAKELVGVVIKHAQGSCPTDPGDTTQLTYKATGPYQDDLPASGSWCYSIWAVRTNGQPSAQPATFTIDIP
jgi:hypothetical protein